MSKLPFGTRLLRQLTRLAALLHDLGKINKALQRYFKYGKNKAQAIRHDLMGCLILAEVIRIAAGAERLTKIKTDRSWVGVLAEALATKEEASNLFEKVVKKNKIIIDPGERKLIKAHLKAPARKTSRSLPLELACCLEEGINLNSLPPLLFGLLWLMLSHHKLPGGQLKKRGEVAFNPENYLNRSYYRTLNDCFRVEDLTYMPWRCDGWRRALHECLVDLLELLREKPNRWTASNKSLWTDLLAHQARPILVYADYYASIGKTCASVDPDQLLKGPFANTDEECRCGSEKSKGKLPYLADPLDRHLLAVHRAVDLFFDYVFTADHDNSPFKKVCLAEIPEDKALCGVPPDEKFRWQFEGERAVGDAGNQSAPFFGAVLGETGSGKTYIGPRLLKAASGGLRFTNGLGLRSLTIQIGKKYVKECGLTKGAHVETVVGTRTARQLLEVELKPDEEPPETESAEEWVTIGNPLLDEQLAKVFGGPRAADMLRAPVLVTTVDHIAHSAEMVGSGEARMLMRVATSDLILDEIDSYCSNDLISLGKLVFLHGFYGRNVVLMSATLSPVIFETLWMAYRHGLEVFFFREGKDTAFRIGLFSNLKKPVILQHPVQDEKIVSTYQEFVEAFSKAIDRQPARHRLKVATLDSERWQASVYDACMDLHYQNHTIDPETKKRFSIGYVRWNNIGPTRDFAKYLFNGDQADGIDLGILCYHGNMLLIEHYHIERELGIILYRRQEDLLFKHPMVRRLLDSATGKDVMVIISTTSIFETGRDFDTDWEVAEPYSTRSPYQGAGRVGRHRNLLLKPEQVNIALLNSPLKALPAFRGNPWSYPGIETSGEYNVMTHPQNDAICQTLDECGIAYGGVGHDGKNAPIILSEEAFFLKGVKRNLTSSGCLKKPANYEGQPLTALEYVELWDRLLKDDAASSESPNKSLLTYLRYPGCKLMNWHAWATRFRKGDARQTIDLYREGSIEDTVRECPFRFIRPKDGKEEPVRLTNYTLDEVQNKERAFLPIDEEALLEEIEARGEGIDTSEEFKGNNLRKRFLSVTLCGDTRGYLRDAILTREKYIHYHPLLGFELKKTK